MVSWLGASAAGSSGGVGNDRRAEKLGPVQLYGMGLHRLRGRVGYPAQAAPRRSSVSRVPENGKHGLKGGYGNGLADHVGTAP